VGIIETDEEEALFGIVVKWEKVALILAFRKA